MEKIPSSEITPEAVYLNRRSFMKVMGAAALGALLAACQSKSPLKTLDPQPADQTPQPGETLGLEDELGDPLTSFEAVTTYNNFYEFSMDKEAVSRLAKDFQTSPWSVTVGGLVNKPRTFAIEDLLKIEQEERIYRMRCVEGWSMVIPWLGFPIRKLLEQGLILGVKVALDFVGDHDQAVGLAVGPDQSSAEQSAQRPVAGRQQVGDGHARFLALGVPQCGGGPQARPRYPAEGPAGRRVARTYPRGEETRCYNSNRRLTFPP